MPTSFCGQPSWKKKVFGSVPKKNIWEELPCDIGHIYVKNKQTLSITFLFRAKLKIRLRWIFRRQRQRRKNAKHHDFGDA